MSCVLLRALAVVGVLIPAEPLVVAIVRRRPLPPEAVWGRDAAGAAAIWRAALSIRLAASPPVVAPHWRRAAPSATAAHVSASTEALQREWWTA